MRKSIHNKLVAGFGFCVLLLVALLGFNLSSLQRLEKLHHDAVKRTVEMELATDAQHVGEDMYMVIANAVINRDMAKSELDWAASKKINLAKLQKVAEVADTPEEHAKVREAKDAINDIIRMFEQEMLPLLRGGAEVPGPLADIDYRIDRRITVINQAMEWTAFSLSKENQEAIGEFHGVLENLLSFGLLISLIGVVAALSISALTTKRIVRPISELTLATRELEKGNYIVELRHCSDDETGVLFNAFRNMSAQVGKRTVELLTSNDLLRHEISERKLAEEELQKAHNELDLKVKERTAELSHANDLLRQEISMHRKTGEALQKSEKRYRSLVVATAQIVWTTSAKGEVFEDQPSWSSFTGQSDQEALGWGWGDALHPEDLEPTRRIWLHALETRTPYKTEYRLRRYDGEYRNFSVRGVPVQEENGTIREWVGTCTDITERKKAEEELIKREARLNEAQRLAHIGSWELDIVNNKLSWSDEEYRIFGMDPKVFGATYAAFLETVHPEDRAMVDKAYTSSLKDKMPYNIVHRLLMPDGRIKYVNEQCQTFYGRDGRPLRSIGTTQDITERKKAAEKIQKQLDRLAALRSIDIAITASLDLRVTLGVLVENAVAQLNADAVCLLIERPHSHVFEYAAGKGFRTEAIRHSHIRRGQSYAGHVAHTRRVLALPDTALDKEMPERPPFLNEEGFRAYFGAPLMAKGSIIGVLEVFQRHPVTPDVEWLDFLEALAGQAAIAIDNANLLGELQRSNDELIMAYDSTLEGWSRALDYRDKETEGHSRRVTEMTVEIARLMGQNEEEIVHFRRGALLHDIGKLGVPDSILLKPGKLTDEEWVLMKKHPQIAHDLLHPIVFLRQAVDIPYCHHEKWDGSGYPRGLEGEEIPLGARVFSVVDIWDALRSDRPYRAAWPVEKVKDHLRSLSGTELDPHIVEIFLKHVDEMTS